MLRFAVIFESSPFDRKGLFNAVHQRVLHLVDTGGCEVDVFCVHSRDNAFTRKVRHTPQVPKVDQVSIDGITYRMLWYDFSITDHVAVKYLRKEPVFFGRFIWNMLPCLSAYDAVLAHSFTGGLIARKVSEKYGVPYFVTWHGSDVHTHPWNNHLILEHTRKVMEGALCNFFVSEALLKTSDKILESGRKQVLHNGVSDFFRRYNGEDRAEFRRRHGLEDDTKVVAFVGSLVAVKNVDLLQPVFHKVRKSYAGPLEFWVIGDGKLRHQVEPVLMGDPTISVRMWGNVSSDQMPVIMNCVDVLVLPSRNEGLPLVCAEAIRCGAVAVGADVGGVSEVIGSENVVPHGPGFNDAFAGKVVEALAGKVKQSLPDTIDWSRTARKELECISGLLK